MIHNFAICEAVFYTRYIVTNYLGSDHPRYHNYHKEEINLYSMKFCLFVVKIIVKIFVS